VLDAAGRRRQRWALVEPETFARRRSWLYRVLTRDGSPAPYGGSYGGTYRLAVGIVSLSGLMYWLVVGFSGWACSFVDGIA
jgi:hypothetical protein